MGRQNNIVMMWVFLHPGDALAGTQRGEACTVYLSDLHLDRMPGKGACFRLELQCPGSLSLLQTILGLAQFLRFLSFCGSRENSNHAIRGKTVEIRPGAAGCGCFPIAGDIEVAS